MGIVVSDTVVVPVTVELPNVARHTTLDWENVTVEGKVN
jgi:hypothetical protein